MANNHSQPYGNPFAYPPQHYQQPEEQNNGPRVHHAHPPHAFPNIPGLQPAAIPGINFTSFAQNSQQSPFPPATWAAQLPPDPSAWLPFLQQNSTFPPPPLPSLGFPPPSLPQTPQHFAIPPAFPPPNPPSAPQQSAVPARERIQEVMDSNREDGELSEGEVSSQPPPAQSSRPSYQQPPRSAPRAPQSAAHSQEAYNPDRPSAGQSVSQKSPQIAPPQSPPSLQDQLPAFREEAKQFIKVLHSHNIGYRALAKEDVNVELLREYYQSLNLPSEPAPIVAPKVNGTSSNAQNKSATTSQAVEPVTNGNVQPRPSVPAVKTTVETAPSAKSAASPVAPGDRREYIARLQAAKMAKQAGGAKPSPPQQTPLVTAPPSAPASTTPQPTPTPTAKQPVTDEQRARNTELIKQRLQALRGKQKPAPPGINGTSQTASQQDGPATQATQAAPSGTTTPNQPQGQMAPFPGIPGLFMNPPPSFATDVRGAPKASASVPQKHQTPSDSTEVSTPGGSVTSYTRPLGRSPHVDHEGDESMIIEVSDDESNGSDMDIDDDQTTQMPKHVVSAANTPGTQTPGAQARNLELEDKEKQLAEMKLVLKRKFAEKREKEKAAAAAAGALSSPQVQTPSIPVLAPPIQTPSRPPTQMSRVITSVPTDAKLLRRAEIQSKLPTFDTETANNTSRISQLTKEIEQLMAQNEQIAKDKALLIEELENLGVDTEGMSHAELQAKKDEIEREAWPEKENLPQDEHVAVQALSSNPLVRTRTASPPPTNRTKSPPNALEPAADAIYTANQSQASTQYTSLPGLAFAAPRPPEPKAVQPLTSTSSSFPTAGVPSTASQDADTSGLQNFSQSGDAPNVASTRNSATPLDDDEDFYSPPPSAADVDLNADATSSTAAQVQTETEPAAARSPSEEGEVEMSESSADEDEEEEYEPEEPPAVTETPVQASPNPQPESAQSIATSQVSTEDEEAYEPPDVDEEMPDRQDENSVAENEAAALDIEADDGAMDIATPSSDESDDSDTDSDEETTPEPHVDSSISANVPQQMDTIADDLAPELQSESAPAVQAAEPNPVPDDEDTSVKFTPYESPLRMFKSYRYHPNYAQDVSGGFLSWTFSHEIDPEKPLCQFEAAGGTCNDTDCPDQHFRDIGITGEKLLVQLGTANPGKTPDEQRRWNDGLRTVLKELRTKNVKDPNGIAVEIAKYRRQYFRDDTRVVNL